MDENFHKSIIAILSDRYRVQDVSSPQTKTSLFIKDIQVEDSTSFTCIATNNFGSSNKSIVLVVQSLYNL